MIVLALAVLQGCKKNQGISEEATVSWASVKMNNLEHEYNLLNFAYSKEKTKAKDTFVPTLLFQSSLSYQDLCQLAASCDILPVRFRDRQDGFRAVILEYIIETFVAMGDRDNLVKLLSKRFVSYLGATHRIELFLAMQEERPQDFRGNRLRNPIMVLGEAYSKCELPEVRNEIVAAIRRGFAGHGIQGKDDAEFVKNAMQWYEREKNQLVVNPTYFQNEIMPLWEGPTISDEWIQREKEGRIEPLFKVQTSRKVIHRVIAVFVIWLIHAGIALLLAAPIVFIGRKRVRWRVWELLAVIIPFCIWAIMMYSDLSMGRKALGNIVETFYFAIAVPVAAIARVSIGSKIPERFCAIFLIFLMCLVAIALFFVMPPLLIIE
jgi:hypothetical protein